jgi:hypothetical protein
MSAQPIALLDQVSQWNSLKESGKSNDFTLGLLTDVVGSFISS